MKKHNNIEELFKDHLQNIEADPGANAWANVQAGVSSASAAPAAVTSSWMSTAIVAITITAVAVGGYFFFNNEGEKKTKQNDKPIIEAVEPQTQENITLGESPIIETNKGDLVDAPKQDEPSVSERSISDLNSSGITQTDTKNESIDIDATPSEISEEMIDQIIAEHQANLNLEEKVEDEENPEDSEEVSTSSEINHSTNPETKEQDNSSENKASMPIELAKEEQNKKITDQVIFPNVFSPNADGSNDIFVLDIKNSIEIDNIKVSIFDKTGKLVNEWSGLYNGWDGKYKDGSTAKKDSYIYKAIILKDNKEYLKVSSFTLLN